MTLNYAEFKLRFDLSGVTHARRIHKVNIYRSVFRLQKDLIFSPIGRYRLVRIRYSQCRPRWRLDSDQGLQRTVIRFTIFKCNLKGNSTKWEYVKTQPDLENLECLGCPHRLQKLFDETWDRSAEHGATLRRAAQAAKRTQNQGAN